MNDLFYAVLAAFVLMVSFVVRPERATCPPGSFANGVRPRGTTECIAEPMTRCDDTRRPELGLPPCPDEDFNRPRGELQIYCTGGSVPILIDEGPARSPRTIGCQARH